VIGENLVSIGSEHDIKSLRDQIGFMHKYIISGGVLHGDITWELEFRQRRNKAAAKIFVRMKFYHAQKKVMILVIKSSSTFVTGTTVQPNFLLVLVSRSKVIISD